MEYRKSKTTAFKLIIPALDLESINNQNNYELKTAIAK